MSYILDALRRADAERRQGQAPDLQQVTALSADAAGGASADDRRGPRWLPLGLVVSLLLLTGAGLAGWWWARGSGPAPAAVASAPAPAVVAAAPAPPPLPAPVTATAPPAALMPAPPPVTAAPPAIRPAPTARPQPRPAEPAPQPPAPAPTAAPAPARPVPASALPEPQRSAVAALSVGGAVHSQDRGQSFVLVGGQIVHEGATLAPGIVLDRIQPRALWLRVDGQLVERPL